MEQKLQIQWQKFGPDHGKCRKTQTAFEQLHSGKKYFCRIAQSLPDHRHAAGGEVNASTAASGLLLTGLCFLAQGTVLVVSPLLQSYLAVSMACCISTQQGLSETCRVMGALLRRGLVWAGRIFAVLLGLQRRPLPPEWKKMYS